MLAPDLAQNSGCLSRLLSLFGFRPHPDKSVSGPLPYRLRDDFLSAAELSFYQVLHLVAGDRVRVCPKVGLADVFFIARPNQNYAYRNRISQKHVDFLVCDAATLRPLVGIELDDPSHNRPDRRERDRFVDRVFEAAGLGLLHVAAQTTYVPGDLLSMVEPYLGPPSDPPASVPTLTSVTPDQLNTVEPAAPVCPKCGINMVLRTASRGEHAGRHFYGCPNYPRCRETRPDASGAA